MSPSAANLEQQPPVAMKSPREREREMWDAYWKIMSVEMRGNLFSMFRYYGWRSFDIPVTWFREKIIEPLHDRNKIKFYHRRFSRVPSIEECDVKDQGCMYQANWQYRLDKMVDTNILIKLKLRMDRCIEYNYEDRSRCVEAIDEYEENDLNYYIKYGEMSVGDSAIQVYMKQKHRMIWERRHPKIMELRAKALEKHREDVKNGIYDEWFYRRGTLLTAKRYTAPTSRLESQESLGTLKRDKDEISQDPLRIGAEQELRREGKQADPHEDFEFVASFP